MSRYNMIVDELRERVPELRQKKYEPDETLAYVVFESELWKLLIDLLSNTAKHSRVQQIMNYMEELAGDSNPKIRDLVGISISESLVSSQSEYFPKILPFLGEKLRQACRESLPNFCARENFERFQQLLSESK